MPIKEGWEISPDRMKWYEKMSEMDPIGDPVITSKCKLGSNNGFLIVGSNGFSWRIKISGAEIFWAGALAAIDSGKNKWVRWYDVANITPKEDGLVIVELKLRKNGALQLDKKGKPKTIKWRLRVAQNKDEKSANWLSRFYTFNDVMLEIFNQYKVETDPPLSDSRM